MGTSRWGVCLSLLVLLGPAARCFYVPRALSSAAPSTWSHAPGLCVRGRGIYSQAGRGLRARAEGALESGFEIDEDALLPLDAGASPRQAEMHRRRRERAMQGLQGYMVEILKRQRQVLILFTHYARALTFQIVLQEDRIAAVAPKLLEGIDSGPGAVAVVDNVLGPEWCEAMRREAIAVTERGLMKGKLVY